MKDIGGGDYQDLMTGVDKLIADGIADPGRLAIRGWSYGGILGGWTITQTSRFKAASLGAMVADWSSEYAMGFNHDVRLWYIGGTPWESADAYRRQSSYTHIATVTTPTLLLARRARHHRHHRPEHDVLPGTQGPRRTRAVHPVSARTARLSRTASSARPRYRRDRLADEVRPRDRLDHARAARGDWYTQEDI